MLGSEASSYAGPFLELEDGADTVVVLKATGERDVSVTGCSALYGTPKVCAMHGRTSAAGARITSLTGSASATDTAHANQIDANAARINQLSSSITDTGSRTTELEIEQMNSMKTLKALFDALATRVDNLDKEHDDAVKSLSAADTALATKDTELQKAINAELQDVKAHNLRPSGADVGDELGHDALADFAPRPMSVGMAAEPTRCVRVGCTGENRGN